MSSTFPALLAAHAADEPNRVALRLGGDWLTYRDWDERSASVAAHVLDRGVAAREPVGLVFDGAGWLGFAVAYCGVQRAGGIAVVLRRLPSSVWSLAFGRRGVDGFERFDDRAGGVSLVRCSKLSRSSGSWNKPKSRSSPPTSRSCCPVDVHSRSCNDVSTSQ